MSGADNAKHIAYDVIVSADSPAMLRGKFTYGHIHKDLERETVDTITRSLVQQIFHRPTTRLRELDDPELGARLAALFAAAPEDAPKETAK